MTRAQWCRATSVLHVLGLALVLIGYFGAWVPHRAVALIVTGRELSEFAKFFPQVQGGVVPIRRTLFLAPLAIGAVLLSLLVNGTARRLWVRVIGTGLALLLAAAVLPSLQFLTDPQYRGQVVLAIGTGLMVASAIPTRRIPAWLRGTLVLLLVFVGVPVALWQFYLLHPLVVALYNQPTTPGWGLVLAIAGTAVLLVAGLLTVIWSGSCRRRA